MRLNGDDKVGQTSLKFARISDGIAQLRQDAVFEQCPPCDERLAHHIATSEHEHIECVVENRRRRRAVILKDVERRLARFVESNNLAIDYGLVRQGGERLDDRGITQAEIIVIARA